jgi:tetratricopeptide (TPR) repeat protein
VTEQALGRSAEGARGPASGPSAGPQPPKPRASEPAAPAVVVPVPDSASAELPEVVPLPAVAEGFVGRTREVRELRAEIDRPGLGRGDAEPRARVLLVTGRPGVGRTTLAVRLAGEVADRYPDGRFFARLTTQEGEAVPAERTARALLAALGAPPGGADPVAALRTATAGRRLLFVLDDVAYADQVAGLLPPSADSLVVATADGPLPGIPDVRPCTLGGLDTPAALDLLAQSIGTTRVTNDPRAAESLTQATSGHPTALRLIASWLTANPRLPLPDATTRLQAAAPAPAPPLRPAPDPKKPTETPARPAPRTPSAPGGGGEAGAAAQPQSGAEPSGRGADGADPDQDRPEARTPAAPDGGAGAARAADPSGSGTGVPGAGGPERSPAAADPARSGTGESGAGGERDGAGEGDGDPGVAATGQPGSDGASDPAPGEPVGKQSNAPGSDSAGQRSVSGTASAGAGRPDGRRSGAPGSDFAGQGSGSGNASADAGRPDGRRSGAPGSDFAGQGSGSGNASAGAGRPVERRSGAPGSDFAGQGSGSGNASADAGRPVGRRSGAPGADSAGPASGDVGSPAPQGAGAAPVRFSAGAVGAEAPAGKRVVLPSAPPHVSRPQVVVRSAVPVELVRAFRVVYGELGARDARMVRLLVLAPGGVVDAQVGSALVGCSVADAQVALDGLVRGSLLVEVAAGGAYRVPGCLVPLLREQLDSCDRPEEITLARARMLERTVRLLQSCHAALAGESLAGTQPATLRFDSRHSAATWLRSRLPALLAAARAAVADGGLDTLARRLVAAFVGALVAFPAEGGSAAMTAERYQLHALVLGVADRRGLHREKAAALINLADLDAEAGRTGSALDRYRQALDAARACADHEAEGRAMEALGGTYLERRDPQRAADWFGRALALRQARGELPQQARLHSRIGTLLMHTERYGPALREWRAAAGVHRRLGDLPAQARALTEAARAQEYAGHPEDALRTCRDALYWSRQAGDRRLEAAVLLRLADTLDRLGDPDAARLQRAAARRLLAPGEPPAA